MQGRRPAQAANQLDHPDGAHISFGGSKTEIVTCSWKETDWLRALDSWRVRRQEGREVSSADTDFVFRKFTVRGDRAREGVDCE